MNKHRHGFTLIELLVVITIIVILLALLVPAMDKAIYQAELTLCGTQIRSVATGFNTYALDNRRFYPVRPLMGQDDGWTVSLLQAGRGAGQAYNTVESGGVFSPDLRPMLRPYMSLNKQLNDPFVEPVDLETSNATNTSFVYSSFVLFPGWVYSDPGYAGGGMRKLGESIAWDGRKYRTMIADVDQVDYTGYAMSSHADDLGVMQNLARQDVDTNTGSAEAGLASGSTLTASWWEGTTRGKIDKNVGYTDLSVSRFMGVEMSEGSASQDRDPRMDCLPWKTTAANFFGDWPQRGVLIPKQ